MRRVAILLVVLAMAIGACGSDDSSTTTADPFDDTPQPTHADVTTTNAGVEPPELAGTVWKVTIYRQPAGGITNTWKADVTIKFGSDGTVSGSAGCNDYQGIWNPSGAYDEFEDGVPDPNDGQAVSIDELSWTEMACEDPAIMDQEAEILDLLQNAGRWVMIRGAFHLRDAAGSFLFETEPA